MNKKLLFALTALLLTGQSCGGQANLNLESQVNAPGGNPVSRPAGENQNANKGGLNVNTGASVNAGVGVNAGVNAGLNAKMGLNSNANRPTNSNQNANANSNPNKNSNTNTSGSIKVNVNVGVNVNAAPQTQSFTIEADDNGFYPSSITVNKGATVKITFKVRTAEVYFGGLRISSSAFNTGALAPGGSATVSFTADSNLTFSSFWPASGVHKADGTVIVK